MSKVQVIIPAINLWKDYTYPAIQSVLKQNTTHDIRILLIDNASNDETSVEAGKLVSNNFAHQRNEERWSCAKSWNFGVKDAFDRGYDYAFVLNNDILLHPNAVENLINYFSLQFPPITKQLAMVTCMNIAGECNPPESIFTFDETSKKDVPIAEHPDFSGFMINKNTYDKVGPFDEGFKPAYYEDNDYHYRINLADMKAVTLPTAPFYHFGSKTQTVIKGEDFHNRFKSNRAYYIAKWGGEPGKETYKTPLNSDDKDIRWIKK